MAGSLFGRKFSSFGAVSRVGPSSRPPATTDNIIANEDRRNNALIIFVAVGTVLALICLCMFAQVLRKNRLIRQRRESGATNVPVVIVQEQTAKVQGLGDDEACKEGAGRWSTQPVELVVMAGEDMPTFLAHPVPAPSTTIIQCPPLQL